MNLFPFFEGSPERSRHMLDALEAAEAIKPADVRGEEGTSEEDDLAWFLDRWVHLASAYANLMTGLGAYRNARLSLKAAADACRLAAEQLEALELEAGKPHHGAGGIASERHAAVVSGR
jgi:hypothetical protein